MADRSAQLVDIWNRFESADFEDLKMRSKDADLELFDLGVTFTVYSDKDVIDRVLPFDIIPRVITAPEWKTLDQGVVQRVAAINAFLHDIYHDQHIIKDGIIPAELVLGNSNYRKEMIGFEPACGVYSHIAGTDIIRDNEGNYLVLEDNVRSPSGVSYVVENRLLMERSFPDLLANLKLRKVSNYGQNLFTKLVETAPVNCADKDQPQVVVMSPGMFNSAYFEHIFLAREMGVPVVEGSDLFCDNDTVYMKTIGGPRRVDVIYRRIDDEFLDPEAFNPESMLGVKGLVKSMRAGNVTIANAIGTGVADDKAVYAYMPRIIKYYLDEEPILANVETHICREADALQYTLDNMADLVVKPVGESGGYGITVGPKASKAELEEARASLIANPSNFISQPMISLSVCPTLGETDLVPRHVDLRPYAITGKDTWVLPGGLTRVALREGSIIVNSSQGGGTKDTWVLAEDTKSSKQGEKS
ncbi:circularly permuted type 2 ATP-grasp protein [Cohaesibacter celericrescens]|nr:circularly permuted type 2 ATP-grasp protein [Cohaesibacter celericrescens]